MAIIITNGSVIYNRGKTSISITNADGVQNLPEDVEARLVSEGGAQYVNRSVTPDKPVNVVATPPKQPSPEKPGDNIPNEDDGSNGKTEAHETPSYNVDMKSTELREIMDDCGIPFKVGMSKADMVAALDDYFGEESDEEEPPDLGAEDPIP